MSGSPPPNYAPGNPWRRTTPFQHSSQRRNDWMDPTYDEDRRARNGIDRLDRVTRATALSMITDLMLNEHLHPSDAVDLLEDLENSCKREGVSLSELLAENMYTGGVPPLMWEIQRCDWRAAPELLMFLVIRTARSKVPWMIRTACQAVGDNDLMQVLRETLEPDVLCHLTSSDFTFEVAVTVRHLADKLRPKQTTWISEGKSGDVKKSSVEPSTVVIEWLVEERAWMLELKADAVELTLLDGPPATVTASLHIDPPDEGNWSRISDVDFPRSTVLLPISRAGRNSLVVWPTWRPDTWGDIVSFQLKIDLKQMIEASGEPVEQEKVTRTPPDEEKVTKTPSDEDDDWVIEYDDGEPQIEEEGNSGWVLASWSGKDEDMDGDDKEHEGGKKQGYLF